VSHDLLVQLSMVELSLASSEADVKDDLIQLQTDLQQLIQLTEGEKLFHFQLVWQCRNIM